MADKLAEFVAKNGPQFEEMTRQKNPGDTPFKCVRECLYFFLLTYFKICEILNLIYLIVIFCASVFAFRFLHDTNSALYKHYARQMAEHKRILDAAKSRGAFATSVTSHVPD